MDVPDAVSGAARTGYTHCIQGLRRCARVTASAVSTSQTAPDLILHPRIAA